jgi:hypothetical protein
MHQALTSRAFGFFVEGYDFTALKVRMRDRSDPTREAAIQITISVLLMSSKYNPTPKHPTRPTSPLVNAAFMFPLYTFLSGVPLTVALEWDKFSQNFDWLGNDLSHPEIN